MIFFHNAILGRAVNWRFATSSPEAEVFDESLHTTLKLDHRGEHERPLRDFLHRHRLFVRVFVLALVWELLAQCIGLLAVTIFPPSTDVSAFFQSPFAFQHGNDPLWETIWARWDGVWYLLIAAQGYGSHVGALHAFFPAFPGLVHIVGSVLGGNDLLAGVLINRMLLFPTVAIFTQLVREESGEEAAESAPLFVLLVPVAVFFLAIYTETLFVLACLACFLAMRHQRWLVAGLCCAVATATRLPGIVLVGAILVEGVVSRKYWQSLVAAALGMSGIAAYALYLQLAYHDALAFQHAYQYGWGGRQFTLRVWTGPQAYLVGLLNHWPWGREDIFLLSCLLALLIDCVLLAVMWRSLRWSYRFFVAGSMLLPLFSGTLFAYNRYSLTLFPLLLVVCRWTAGRPTVRQAVLLTSGFFSVLGIVMFTSSYWVG